MLIAEIQFKTEECIIALISQARLAVADEAFAKNDNQKDERNGAIARNENEVKIKHRVSQSLQILIIH